MSHCSFMTVHLFRTEYKWKFPICETLWTKKELWLHGRNSKSIVETVRVELMPTRCRGLSKMSSFNTTVRDCTVAVMSYFADPPATLSVYYSNENHSLFPDASVWDFLVISKKITCFPDTTLNSFLVCCTLKDLYGA